MPTYQFICEKCNCSFNINCYICDYDAVKSTLRCVSCKSNRIYRDYQKDNIMGHIEQKTIGSLADKNTDKMSEEQKLDLYLKHNDYLYNEPEKELKPGMERIRKKPTKLPIFTREKRKPNDKK